MLLVEEHAHWTHGHFPNRYVELADAFASLGCRVEILTARGTGTVVPRHRVHRFGFPLSIVARAAAWLRRPHLDRRETAVQRFGHALGTFATVMATRALGRRSEPRPDAAVVLGLNTDPALVAGLAGEGRWLLYQFGSPDAASRWRSTTMQRITATWARRNVACRRAGNDTFRLACAHEPWRDEWASRLPFLEPVELPIAGVRPFTRVPGARARLGISPEHRTALLFGSGANSDRTTALRAFADDDAWRLVVAGSVADGLDPSTLPRSISIVAVGTVDEATRQLLFSAVDLVVLSFKVGYWNDSGVLMDAISAGVPVACSEASTAAEVVREFRLGATFTPGDAADLRRALDRAVVEFDEHGLERARNDRSNAAVAREMLDVLGLWPRT